MGTTRFSILWVLKVKLAWCILFSNFSQSLTANGINHVTWRKDCCQGPLSKMRLHKCCATYQKAWPKCLENTSTSTMFSWWVLSCLRCLMSSFESHTTIGNRLLFNSLWDDFIGFYLKSCVIFHCSLYHTKHTVFHGHPVLSREQQ